MKKTVFYILPLVALLLASIVSCDVTRDPKSTPKQAPFKKMLDVEMNRDALYAFLRNTESPNTLNMPDYMSDLFQVTDLDNNTHLPIYSWEQQSMIDHDFVTTYYFYNYYSMMQANYFIMRVKEMIENEAIEKTPEDIKLMEQYIGEAKVIRALAHWRVVQRFARPWIDGDPAQREMGIIVMDKYAPLETAKEPKRSREDVYKFIYQDLDDAIAAIPADANKEVKPAIRITQDYVYALKARAALTRHDWKTALDCSQHVIDRYPLSAKEDISKLWVTEDSPEILVRLYTTPSIGGISSGLYSAFYYDDVQENGSTKTLEIHAPIMVLAQWVVDLYESTDARRQAFVGNDYFYMPEWKLMFAALTKFKGNPSLDRDKKRRDFQFGLHLFSAAEAYLINIEAALMLKDMATATNSFQAICASRGHTFVPAPTPDAMLLELKAERVRELIGEGFRMDDLVRWGEGMKRNPKSQSELAKNQFIKGTALDLEIAHTDKRMIWEFPTRDINNNPDLSANRNWK